MENSPVSIRNLALIIPAVLCLLVFFAAEVFSSSMPEITLEPPDIGQGEVSLLTIKNNGFRPQVRWRGKKIFLVNRGKNGDWAGFLGADLTVRPGTYKIQIKAGDKNVYLFLVEVVPSDHGVRRFTVPKKMEALDDETLERVKKESKKVKRLFTGPFDSPLWSGKWIRPVPGIVVSPFGCITIINGIERSPHSGTDFKAADGDPVKAVNRGKAVMVADHFFSGRSVFIDHGGGIQSMYFHLSKVLVKPDQLVEKGDVIGLCGSTGRSTGAHLHFGIRLNGERVSPIGLIDKSGELIR